MRFYQIDVTIKAVMEVEAESLDEAERILNGCIDNATEIKITEGDDDEINGVTFTIEKGGPVRVSPVQPYV